MPRGDRVHLYTVSWNEQAMLGYFFRHYDRFVDRYVFYDDGSDDGTRERLEAHPRVEIRRFERTDPNSFILSARALYDRHWKESRGAADWVIVGAVDEHLWHPRLRGVSRRHAGVRSHGDTGARLRDDRDRFPRPGRRAGRNQCPRCPRRPLEQAQSLRSERHRGDALRRRTPHRGADRPGRLSRSGRGPPAALQVPEHRLRGTPPRPARDRSRPDRPPASAGATSSTSTASSSSRRSPTSMPRPWTCSASARAPTQ